MGGAEDLSSKLATMSVESTPHPALAGGTTTVPTYSAGGGVPYNQPYGGAGGVVPPTSGYAHQPPWASPPPPQMGAPPLPQMGAPPLPQMSAPPLPQMSDMGTTQHLFPQPPQSPGEAHSAQMPYIPQATLPAPPSNYILSK
jgi:hypothetical protein